MDAIPQKTLTGLRDYPRLAEQVTVKDLQVILKRVGHVGRQDPHVHRDERYGRQCGSRPSSRSSTGAVMINPLMGGRGKCVVSFP